MISKEELAEYYITFGMWSEALVEKWIKTGLLEGLNTKDLSQNKMAVLLENQTRQIYADGEKGSSESTEQRKRIVLPLVRRVFGPYVASEKFHVTAMPSVQIPIENNLVAVGVFADRFKFPEPILNATTGYCAIDNEAEFCADVCEAITDQITPIITAASVVLVFMPFSELVMCREDDVLQAEGFAIRWFHE